MPGSPKNEYCIAILKSIARQRNCRWNLVGDANRRGAIADGLGAHPGPLSSDERRDANEAFDWLVTQDLTRRADEVWEGDWIEITERGTAALTRGSVRACDVFITHAAVDGSLAILLKQEFEARICNQASPSVASRCFCSSDPTDLPAGSDWPNAVQEALRTARVIVFIATPVSIVRPWVWFELGTGWFDDHKTIIPVCFGGLHPGALPPPMHTRQAIHGGDLQAVLAAVARELNATADSTGAPEASQRLRQIDASLSDQRNEAMVVVPVLQTNESILVVPARPSRAQAGGFSVVSTSGEAISLQKSSSPQSVSIPRTGLIRVSRFGLNEGRPAELYVHGRLQWMSLKNAWEYRGEPPTDDLGTAYRIHTAERWNHEVMLLFAQAQSYGVNLKWVDPHSAHTELRQPGELIYFNDGRYVVAPDGKFLARA